MEIVDDRCVRDTVWNNDSYCVYNSKVCKCIITYIFHRDDSCGILDVYYFYIEAWKYLLFGLYNIMFAVTIVSQRT